MFQFKTRNSPIIIKLDTGLTTLVLSRTVISVFSAVVLRKRIAIDHKQRFTAYRLNELVV